MFESVESILDADFGKQVHLNKDSCFHRSYSGYSYRLEVRASHIIITLLTFNFFLQSEGCILHLIDEDERTDGRMDGQKDRLTDGIKDRRTDGRTDERPAHEYILQRNTVCAWRPEHQEVNSAYACVYMIQ